MKYPIYHPKRFRGPMPDTLPILMERNSPPTPRQAQSTESFFLLHFRLRNYHDTGVLRCAYFESEKRGRRPFRQQWPSLVSAES